MAGAAGLLLGDGVDADVTGVGAATGVSSEITLDDFGVAEGATAVEVAAATVFPPPFVETDTILNLRTLGLGGGAPAELAVGSLIWKQRLAVKKKMGEGK